MIPQTTNTLVQSNVNNSTEFSINTSSFAFDILSDKLYSNKILAVVREYLTNALDAQKTSGVITPIEVTEPVVTFAEKVPFSVRDFGTGLSEEDVYKYYCVYFSSSKQESNDVTGMLGLGCKAGFAYTEQFNITSWFKGKESKYVLYKENGVPKISKLYEKPSSEPSGLKVTINVVNVDDEIKFKQCIRNVLKYFPEEYVDSKYHNTDKYIIKAKTYRFSPEYDKDGVIMGNVFYPYKFRHKYVVPAKSFILELPIGSIPILPSREGISLDSKTEEFLQREFNKLEEKAKNLSLNVSKKWGKHAPKSFKAKEPCLITNSNSKYNSTYISVTNSTEFLAIIPISETKGIKKLIEVDDRITVIACRNKALMRKLRRFARCNFVGKLYYNLADLGKEVGVDIKTPTKKRNIRNISIRVLDNGKFTKETVTYSELLEYGQKGFKYVKEKDYIQAATNSIPKHVKWVISTSKRINYIYYSEIRKAFEVYSGDFSKETVISELIDFYLKGNTNKLTRLILDEIPYNSLFIKLVFSEDIQKYISSGILSISVSIYKLLSIDKSFEPKIISIIEDWVNENYQKLLEIYNAQFNE